MKFFGSRSLRQAYNTSFPDRLPGINEFKAGKMRMGGRKSEINPKSINSPASRLALSLNNFDRVPLEEMYNIPNLPSEYLNKLSRVDLASLRTFKMPVTVSQIRNSLEREFPGRSLKKTNWKFFPANFHSRLLEDSSLTIINHPVATRTTILMAKKLVTQRLFHKQIKLLKREQDKALSLDTVMPYEDLPAKKSISLLEEQQANRSLLKEESNQLWQDIQSKNYRKYTGAGLIHDSFKHNLESIDSLSPECRKALDYAALAVGKNATMSCALKADSLRVIYNVFTYGKKGSI